MLLTDNDVVSLADLAQVDSELPDVAAAEEINVEGVPGIIRQTWAEAKNELMKAQQQYAVTYWGGTNVANVGSAMASAPRIRPSQIVTSSPYQGDLSSLKVWMVYLALARFYDSASNRSLKDRYALKADKFRTNARLHFANLWSNGLPVVWAPLECPGAIHSVAGGVWSSSSVYGVTGGTDVAMSYDVAITYVDLNRYASPYNNNNAESGPSGLIQVRLDDNQRIAVSIAGLNPPNPVLRPARGDGIGLVGLTASGWNVYAAPAGDPLTLQNTIPLLISQTTYTFTAAPGNSGPMISTGQRADTSVPMTHVFFRG